jgi:hypothetical protein
MNFFLTNWLEEGRERKLDGPAKKVGRLCVHVHAHSICLPSFPPADFKEQAGRTQGLHNQVRAPSLTLLGLLLHLDPSCAVFDFMDFVTGESSPVTGKKTSQSCVVFEFMDYVTSQSSLVTGKKWDLTGDLTDEISPTCN